MPNEQMKAQYRCPSCQTSTFVYKTKFGYWVCEQCDQGFDEKSLSMWNDGFKAGESHVSHHTNADRYNNQ